MVTLTVLYGTPTDPAAFEQYYSERHMPLVATIPGLGRWEAARALPGADGAAPPFYRIFTAWFDTAATLHAALATDQGRAAAADMANFATGGDTLFISEVDLALAG